MKYAISTLSVLITYIVLQLSSSTIIYFYMQDSPEWTSVAMLTPAVSTNHFFEIEYIQLLFVFLSSIVGFATLKLIERRERGARQSKSSN
ncbi:hypothetical protein [Bacillus bingmayongensis]|uniref:Uncharacterized protein n=1 Tax=Bacillus bingmayongensis TaxID=1150157 RepID=A0ABU5K2B2_9BACI|nr:hypothetical protein [Bacillus bingmayongensis]MBY0595309.1 hypothetical protein [Bacillus bingmayongensis]MDZ5609532.1 hypothetical protein [Bacillus pseudomycoides]